MDFVRLGEQYVTTYVPDLLIEGYNSLIWTERFSAIGEFELKSFDVDLMLAQLPEDTLVSHLDTREVMQVETHAIDWVGEGADARPEITVRGRSAVNILNHRWVESSYQAKRRMRKKYSATSALCVLLYNAIDNPSGFDVTRGDTDPDTKGVVNSYTWTTKDVIPNIHVTENVPTEGVTKWFQLEQGMLWPQFEKIMLDADLGIRTMRPVSPNPGTVVTVNSALATRGTVVRTANADIPGLRFEIYKAANRSTAVQFSQLQGHLDKPNYLRSVAEMKTVVEMISGVVNINDIYRTGEGALSGWRRKTMGFDAGQPEIPAAPSVPDALGKNPTAAQRNKYHDDMSEYYADRAQWRNKRASIIADFQEAQRDAALVELKKLSRINMIAGDISLLSPHIYKVHYDLGDLVTLVGDYGPPTVMEVAEYVRTEDSNGDRGFPGLVVPGTT